MKKLLLIAFLAISASAQTEFLKFKSQDLRITTEDNFIYFNIKKELINPEKWNYCMIQKENDGLKNIFCIKKDNLRSYVSPISGEIKNNKLFIYNVLFELEPLDLEIKKLK